MAALGQASLRAAPEPYRLGNKTDAATPRAPACRRFLRPAADACRRACGLCRTRRLHCRAAGRAVGRSNAPSCLRTEHCSVLRVTTVLLVWRATVLQEPMPAATLAA